MYRFKFLIFILLLMTAGIGNATTIIPKSAQDLSQQADVIFVGTCIARVAKGNAPAAIDYTFSIDTPVKGDLKPGATFGFRQPGGLPSTMTRGLRVAGIPDYDQGKRYMLFLGAAGEDGIRLPVGGGQGVFRVLESSGESIIVQDTLGGRWLFPQGSSQGTLLGKSVGAARGSSLNLNTFIQDIRKTGGTP